MASCLIFRGTLFNLLVILISKPKVPKSCSKSDAQPVADPTSAEVFFDSQVRWEPGGLAEWNTCGLLFLSFNVEHLAVGSRSTHT
jgi:hypothetical protein